MRLREHGLPALLCRKSRNPSYQSPRYRDHSVVTTWKQDAAGKRRALRANNDLAERRVTLTFSWRTSRIPSEMRALRVTAEKRERAVDNLAALARACEWLRLAEVRGIHSIIAILLRQMQPQTSGNAGQQSQQQHERQQHERQQHERQQQAQQQQAQQQERVMQPCARWSDLNPASFLSL